MFDFLLFSNEYCHLCLDKKSQSYICEDCAERLEIIDGIKELDHGFCYYPLFYNNFIKSKVKAFKYQSDTFLVKPFAEILIEHLQRLDLEYDYISYIPMYPKDEFKRGYNQGKILAEFVADFTKKPLINLGSKIKPTQHQNKLHRKDRFTNLKGAFEIDRGLKLDGKRLLIIDDLVTTGSTFNIISTQLKEVYNVDMIFIALASSKIDTQGDD